MFCIVMMKSSLQIGATRARVIEPLPPEQRPDLGKQLLMEFSSGITRLPSRFGKGKKDSEAAMKMRTYLDRRAILVNNF